MLRQPGRGGLEVEVGLKPAFQASLRAITSARTSVMTTREKAENARYYVGAGRERMYGMEEDHVRGEKMKESEPLKLPDSLTTIHRPILVSCPTPATSNTESFFASPHE